MQVEGAAAPLGRLRHVAQAHPHVLADGLPGEEAVFLEDHAHAARPMHRTARSVAASPSTG